MPVDVAIEMLMGLGHHGRQGSRPLTLAAVVAAAVQGSGAVLRGLGSARFWVRGSRSVCAPIGNVRRFGRGADRRNRRRYPAASPLTTNRPSSERGLYGSVNDDVVSRPTVTTLPTKDTEGAVVPAASTAVSVTVDFLGSVTRRCSTVPFTSSP